jgi:hypothetical protein
MNFGRSHISKGKNAKKKNGFGAVFGLFKVEGRATHELLVGWPIVWPRRWVVFVQKSRAFFARNSERGGRTAGCILPELQDFFAKWPRIGRSRPSAHPIRRPRDAGDVATLAGPLLLRES